MQESLDIDGSQQFFADCSVGPELQNVGVVLVMQNMTDTNGSMSWPKIPTTSEFDSIP